MGDTEISWTRGADGSRGKSWNFLRGCSRTIAKGAKQSGCGDGTGGGCYAERTAGRFCGKGEPFEGLVRITAKGARWTGEVRLILEHLSDPIRWRKPRKIFVNSVSDLFHESVPNEQIAAGFGVMAATGRHIHQFLTKRAGRKRDWCRWVEREAREANGGKGMTVPAFCFIQYQKLAGDERLARSGDVVAAALRAPWPLPNVWDGVSVENQEAAEERIPLHLETPSTVHFLSVEPLIAPVKLGKWLAGEPCGGGYPGGVHSYTDGDGRPVVCPVCGGSGWLCRRIDWVIVGCESGPGARPCEVEWLRSLRNECAAAGVAFFLKQAVEHSFSRSVYPGTGAALVETKVFAAGPGSKVKAAGVIELPYLDGVQHFAFPETA